MARLFCLQCAKQFDIRSAVEWPHREATMLARITCPEGHRLTDAYSAWLAGLGVPFGIATYNGMRSVFSTPGAPMWAQAIPLLFLLFGVGVAIVPWFYRRSQKELPEYNSKLSNARAASMGSLVLLGVWLLLADWRSFTK